MTAWLLAVVAGASLAQAAAPATSSARKSTVVTHRAASVQIAEEMMILPTYDMGMPEPNPIFYTHESYQGAQKRVYPYALQDNLTHTPTNKAWKVLRLENEHIRVRILPEVGGRLFEAVDKANNYDFFYRQHVIKPALIGMLGAWISGGVEWCVFHHHRNTTFMPVDYTLANNADGSKTIWFGETERRHRMRWIIGITLYPDKSYIEATVKCFNRTPLPNSMLYWANVAVHVNDQYQVIFPPSVQAATYHSKIDFSHWPIGQGRYQGVDYTGVDLSWWKNHPEPVSFFAWDLQEDFMGGYDHGRKAGMVHVANHNVVCGAKLWEWGTGPSGRRWDSILTDQDGPYAELMVGAYSDNQPDYSWIKPYEVRTFRQYWFPVREMGGFKQANLNGALNLELRTNGVAALALNTTSRHRNARVSLKSGSQVLYNETVDIDPTRPFHVEVTAPPGTKPTDLRAALAAADGRELLVYQPVVRPPLASLPEPVKPPPPPKDIASVEEVYLTGLRIEQIHNPSVDPETYYREVLRRDAGDSRAHIALGIRDLKRGLFSDAESHFRKALERLSAAYTRPMDTEAAFYLGLALRAQGKLDEAYTQLYRAAWDRAWSGPARYHLAEIAARRGDFPGALEMVNESLAADSVNTKGRDLKAAVLRKLRRFPEAEATAAAVLRMDPLDTLAMNELRLALQEKGGLSGARNELARLEDHLREDPQSYLELASDYINWGFVDEAIELLARPADRNVGPVAAYPLVHYYLGFLHTLNGDATRAAEYWSQARNLPITYVFPFRLETWTVLESALKHQPKDARALYYLGNLLYELQPEKAVECWRQAITIEPALATAHRNLGWALYRTSHDITNAIAAYKAAVEINPDDHRPILELDQLCELANYAPTQRLAMLQAHEQTVRRRGDSFGRLIEAQVLAGKYDAAIGNLTTNFFHVKEGGGEIHDTYADAHLLRGMQYLKIGDAAQALRHFRQAGEYPDNLSVGRPKNDRRSAQIEYSSGLAFEVLGDLDSAGAAWRRAADLRVPDSWLEARAFQAFSLRKLRENEKADKILDQITERAKSSLNQEPGTDFFAKFGEGQNRAFRQAAAHYHLGLALYARGDRDQARAEFLKAADLNQSHAWASYFAEAVK